MQKVRRGQTFAPPSTICASSQVAGRLCDPCLETLWPHSLSRLCHPPPPFPSLALPPLNLGAAMAPVTEGHTPFPTQTDVLQSRISVLAAEKVLQTTNTAVQDEPKATDMQFGLPHVGHCVYQQHTARCVKRCVNSSPTNTHLHLVKRA